MNKTITKFLLAGEKFMSELHLRQPGFTNCICGPFTKHNEKIQTFNEVGNLKYFYWNQFDKACFACDTVYSDSKYLAERTISDKALKDRVYELSKNLEYDGYQGVLISMVMYSTRN